MPDIATIGALLTLIKDNSGSMFGVILIVWLPFFLTCWMQNKQIQYLKELNQAEAATNKALHLKLESFLDLILSDFRGLVKLPDHNTGDKI
jgi:hypothetical protein